METKHFNRLDKLSALLKRTLKNGNLELRNFPRMQHRKTKIKMRHCMENTLRGSSNYSIYICNRSCRKRTRENGKEVRFNESL